MEKKNRIHTQVDDRFLSYVKKYSEENNISISKLIRKALSYYIRFSKPDQSSTNPMILIAKTELAFILEELNENKVKELAELTYNNAVRERLEYIDKFSTEEERKIFKLKPRILFSTLSHQVFGTEGQNWFKEIRATFHENRLIIGGIHGITKNFSIFFKYYMMKHMSDHGYQLNNEKLDKDRIYLDFNRK